MSRRSTTLLNSASVDITREIASKYDNVKAVAAKITEVETVANADLAQMSLDIQDILDFTNFTVVTGSPAYWDSGSKVLTVPKGDKGDAGNDGNDGGQGDQGQKGDQGDQGVSVHHIKGTSTTDPEGDFSTAGRTDTYTLWGDAGETINLGFFSVTNGYGTEDIMGKPVYDTDDSGVVDDSEALGGKTLVVVESERDSAIASALITYDSNSSGVVDDSEALGGKSLSIVESERDSAISAALAVYDTDVNGIADDSELLEGKSLSAIESDSLMLSLVF